MTPWTDLDALCEALRETKSRGEAAALVATFKRPRRLSEPRGVDFLDEQQDEAMSAAEGGRMVLEGLKSGTAAKRPR